MFIFVCELHWDETLISGCLLMFSLTLHSKRSVSVVTAEDTSLPRKGNRAVVPNNIHFNRMCGSKVLQWCDGNTYQLSRCGARRRVLWLQPCKRLASMFSLWSLGVDQSFYHCLTSPPLHPPVLVASTSYFYTANGLLGESCAFCPAHLMAGGVEVGGQLLSRSACAAGYRNWWKNLPWGFA